MWIIRYKNLFLLIALGIIGVAAGIVFLFGIKPGIDFTGGTLLELTYTTAPERSEVETTLNNASLGGALIRQSVSDVGIGYLISTRDLENDERLALETSLKNLGEGGSVVRATSIGPVIGQELQDKAVWAIAAVLLITICYVAFAFAGIGRPVSSWVYGFMTILILGHDILVPIALMSFLGQFFGFEADILFVTALLTILGYSVNDTIVIFDRVREKLVQNRTETKVKHVEPGGITREEVSYTITRPFKEIVGTAVDETMVRSVNTSLTVLIALGALYFFGSSVTQHFVLVLIAGVIAGAYSSIFIASPLLVTYAQWLERKEKRANASKQ